MFFKFFICIILKIKQCSCGIAQFISPVPPSTLFPSDRTMVLGLTQPLMKTNTRNIPGGKGGRCVRLTISPPSRAKCHEILETKPPGTLWATLGLLRDCLPSM